MGRVDAVEELLRRQLDLALRPRHAARVVERVRWREGRIHVDPERRSLRGQDFQHPRTQATGQTFELVGFVPQSPGADADALPRDGPHALPRRVEWSKPSKFQGALEESRASVLQGLRSRRRDAQVGRVGIRASLRREQSEIPEHLEGRSHARGHSTVDPTP